MTVNGNSSPQFDVIVAGGGPGGSTLASLVAMQGRKVLLLESERFPRYQIGESLLPATVHGICNLLGVSDEVKSAGFVRKNGAAFRWGTSPEPWIFGFGQARMLEEIGANYAFQVERSKFDNILMNRAKQLGVDVREECRVERLIMDNGRVVGVAYVDAHGTETTVHARYVADATGNTTRLYRHVGDRVFSQFFRNVALFGYFEGATRLPAPNSGNILCEAFSKGWMWFIPLSMTSPTLTSVGAVIGNEVVQDIQNSPEQAMQDAIAACPKIRGLLASAQRVTTGQYGKLRVRKDWSYTNERFWKPGMVLIGDAACFIDPVLSTGVHLSTYSALLAARSINSCLRDGLDEELAFSEFEARYRMEFESFYNYLVAFYDMNRDEQSYYWAARKVLMSEENANEAFVRLVAGGATAADIYVKARAGLGDKLQAFADELEQRPGLDHRSDVAGAMAKALRGNADDTAAPLPGSEDLRKITWGADMPAAQSTQSTPAPAVMARPLVASDDGFHWARALP
jgi:halogenation protein CepH